MINFIKQNWFKLGLLLILSTIVSVYVRNSEPSISELYKINSDCANKAQEIAKSKDTIITTWQVNESVFKKDSCFAELSSWDSVVGNTKEIIDITHSRDVASVGDLTLKNDPNAYFTQQQEYQKVHLEIFGK